MKLYEILGVEEDSQIEVSSLGGSFIVVGNTLCKFSIAGGDSIALQVLLGIKKYRPIAKSSLDQETIDKLNALKVVFDNKGWIAKDRKNDRVYWWDAEPCLASNGSEWITSGADFCGGIRAATINIPTDVCYDLSKPIPTEEPWRRVVDVTWTEVEEDE